VPITYRVAGMGSRLLAWLADCGVIALLFVAGAMFAGVLDLGRQGLGTALVILWAFALQWGYFLFFEWLWAGQTPGKRLVGIRVIQEQGTAISFYQSAVRNILRAADSPFVPLYGVAFAVAACDRYHRRLGDLAAGTLVVHMERRGRAVQPLPEAPVAADRAQEAQVRQRLGQLDRRQKQAVLDLCLRRDQLPPRDRVQMFRAAADYFQGRLNLDRDEYQSDEKFVLQIAALLGERTRV
jgi:uncharacterized RDD family membrane protein YckC